jgi:predicted nucleotidyltransferase component of viral defense system
MMDGTFAAKLIAMFLEGEAKHLYDLLDAD